MKRKPISPIRPTSPKRRKRRHIVNPFLVRQEDNSYAQALVAEDRLAMVKSMTAGALVDVLEWPVVQRAVRAAAERRLYELVSAMPRHANPLPGPVLWMPASSPPDHDIAVLIACADGDEPVWLGYLDGDTWRTVEGHQVTVTHWADLPAPPK